MVLVGALAFSSAVRAQIFTGNLTPSSQAEVAAFNYTNVTGSLTGITGFKALQHVD
jgi:hypothetical protein